MTTTCPDCGRDRWTGERELREFECAESKDDNCRLYARLMEATARAEALTVERDEQAKKLPLIEREAERLRHERDAFRSDLTRERAEAIERFAVEFRDNWDCDLDAHRYGTVCRCCEAARLLALPADPAPVGPPTAWRTEPPTLNEIESIPFWWWRGLGVDDKTEARVVEVFPDEYAPGLYAPTTDDMGGGAVRLLPDDCKGQEWEWAPCVEPGSAPVVPPGYVEGERVARIFDERARRADTLIWLAAAKTVRDLARAPVAATQQTPAAMQQTTTRKP